VRILVAGMLFWQLSSVLKYANILTQEERKWK